MKAKYFILRSLCLLFLFLSGGAAWAYDFKSGFLYYNVLSEEDGTVKVVGGYDRTDIDIPSRVHDASGKEYVVTEIANRAFSESNGYVEWRLRRINIPNSIVTIGDSAFADCRSLTSVEGGNGIKTIGASAFVRCRALTSIRISNIVTTIGDYAFYDCDALTSVEIGNRVITIGDYAFCGCSSLTSVEIGNSVTTIGASAFGGCSSLASVEIPNSVTAIGDDAFSHCYSLPFIEIPNSVTTIGAGAFSYCSSLTSVKIPNNVTAIGDYAFSYCSSLTTMEIASGVVSIGSGVFVGCRNLATIFMDPLNQHYTSVDGVLYTIYKDTLIVCPRTKTSVEILNGVTTIEGGAFYNCSSLTSVEIPNSVTTIGNEAFYDCSSLTSVEIPNNVTTIENSAFSGCRSLASVEIGNNVTTIGYGAFWRCDSIRTIYCRMPEPIECDPDFSDDVLLYATLYVPTGTKAAYEQVDPWRSFYPIIETDFEDATAIESVTADGAEATVTVENGVIVLKGDSRLPVEVYSVGGQCLYRGTDHRIAGLPNGVYVVKIGNHSQKIVL